MPQALPVWMIVVRGIKTWIFGIISMIVMLWDFCILLISWSCGGVCFLSLCCFVLLFSLLFLLRVLLLSNLKKDGWLTKQSFGLPLDLRRPAVTYLNRPSDWRESPAICLQFSSSGAYTNPLFPTSKAFKASPIPYKQRADWFVHLLKKEICLVCEEGRWDV